MNPPTIAEARDELGKTLAGQRLSVVEGKKPATGHHASTAGRIDAIGFFRRY